MAHNAARLLVVDDDENNRDMLSRRLLRHGFQVAVASDGFGAIDSIGRENFDLVLLDIEMPGMSGFDVLKKVRLEHAATRLPIIIATARTDREDVVEALGLGANDYVTKPLDFPVVLARVETQLSHKRAVDRIVALEDDLRRRNMELELAYGRMRRSLDVAADMQRSLLPAGPIPLPGIEFAWVFQPCDELGGDILNVFPLGEHHVIVYLLDVSGHGVPAALLSVTLSRMLTYSPGQSSLVAKAGDSAIEPRPPGEVVGELNQRFQMEGKHGQYFTLFYGVLDLRTRRMRYVSAGHPPAIIVPASGSPRLGDAEGFAVGWFPEARFEEYNIDLSPGDRLYVYSDGVVETMDKAFDLFGAERLAQTFERCRDVTFEQSLGAMLDDIAAHRGTSAILDDVSALAIGI